MRSSRAMIRVVAVIQGNLWSPSGGVGSNRTSDTMKCSVVKRTKKTKNKQTVNGDASKTQLARSKLTSLMNQTHVFTSGQYETYHNTPQLEAYN